MLQYDWKTIVKNEEETPTLPITPFELSFGPTFIVDNNTAVSIPNTFPLYHSEANFAVYMKNKFNIEIEVS